MDEETQVNPWAPAKPDMMELARKSGIWIAVLSLGAAVVMFLIAANRMIEIWFRYQYVPIARMVIALLIGGVSLAVIWRLTRSARSR